MSTNPIKPLSVRYELVDKNLPVIRDQARIMANVAPGYLESLAESIAVVQLQEIGIYFERLADAIHMRVIWGNCRVLASRLKPEITHLRAAIFDQPITESEFLLMRAMENFHRLDLTDYEKYRTCKELMVVNPDWQGKVLAANLKLDPSMITRIMSLDRCIDPVKKAAESGLLGVSRWYPISKQPTEEAQAEMFAKASAGWSRDEMEKAGRKDRHGHAPTVRVAKIKAPLPSGVEVVISGQELGMEDVIDSLSELLKQAKKAKDSFLDVKTWSAVLKDKAKAGA